MTLALIMLLLGTLAVYGGWTNKSIVNLIRGDNTVTK